MHGKANLEFYISYVEKNQVLEPYMYQNFIQTLKDAISHMEEQDRRISSDIEQIARLHDKVRRYEEGMKAYQNM